MASLLHLPVFKSNVKMVLFPCHLPHIVASTLCYLQLLMHDWLPKISWKKFSLHLICRSQEAISWLLTVYDLWHCTGKWYECALELPSLIIASLNLEGIVLGNDLSELQLLSSSSRWNSCVLLMWILNKSEKLNLLVIGRMYLHCCTMNKREEEGKLVRFS